MYLETVPSALWDVPGQGMETTMILCCVTIVNSSAAHQSGERVTFQLSAKRVLAR